MLKAWAAPIAVLCGLAIHYLCFYAFGIPLWTETIAEWIMARTPSREAVWLLANLGAWSKPFAMTGGLAVLGGAVSLAALTEPFVGAAVGSVVLGWWFGYRSLGGQLSFWIPAATVLWLARRRAVVAVAGRREFLSSTAMAVGVAAVAGESFVRNRWAARGAAEPVALVPFHAPADVFAPGLVRKIVTPTPEFYGMSKDAIDPLLDARRWRLRITVDGKAARELSYGELLALPRVSRYVTLRCISNTLESDLMGTALWHGFPLSALIEKRTLPADVREAAVIGVDGHGDSYPLEYLFSDEPLLAVGMNGKTLDRVHGYPLRLVTPRYYGFKHVKWIGEIAFRSQPYYGTWPKLGYTREPVIHTASHIDQVRYENGQMTVGGVSFAGVRGVRAVEVRAGHNAWTEAVLDKPLSPYTWTRWTAKLPEAHRGVLQARAQDGNGQWQEDAEGPLFPDGVRGPTFRKLG